MRMKPQLLEYLVRACTREVLKQLNEEAETKGAPAPPADGQGTADQPPVPKAEPAAAQPEAKPSQPETPKLKPIKGINVVNPREKSEIKPLDFRGKKDPASIERTLYSRASAMAGSKVKVALSTIRAVTKALENPNTPLFLYIGQYDPQSDELYLMADSSIDVAKDASVNPEELAAGELSTYHSTDPADPAEYDPETMGAAYVQKSPGFNDRSQHEPEVEFGDNSMDEQIRKLIKKMVNETLDPR